MSFVLGLLRRCSGVGVSRNDRFWKSNGGCDGLMLMVHIGITLFYLCTHY
jgi:hypothetical protein